MFDEALFGSSENRIGIVFVKQNASVWSYLRQIILKPQLPSLALRLSPCIEVVVFVIQGI
jgi:hypothetical protein